MKHIIIIILSLLVAQNAFADYRGNCDKLDLGWNFYCDPQQEVKKEKPKEPKKEVTKSLAEIADQKTKDMQKKHDELLNIAIHFPTKENIYNYIKFNQKILNKGSFFAESAQRVIWQNPDTNYSLKRPINTVAKRTWIEERNRKQKESISEIAKEYGIFFFYRSDCPYCHAYSPVLKAFTDNYNIEVIAISLDGKAIKEWPESRIDKGQAAKLGIDVVPATILFDKKNSKITPIGFGALSQEEIANQIYTITQIPLGSSL